MTFEGRAIKKLALFNNSTNMNNYLLLSTFKLVNDSKGEFKPEYGIVLDNSL